MSLVLEPLALWALGASVGAVGTIVGAGGGFILVPILLLFYPDLEAKTVSAIALTTVLANSSSGSLAYLRQHRVDLHSAAILAIATIPGAVVGALVVSKVSSQSFALLFAALLLAALVMVIAGPRLRDANNSAEAGPVGALSIRRQFRDRLGVVHTYTYRVPIAVLSSLVAGFASSFFGVGGGFIHVPVLITFLGFPVHVATATSQSVLAVMSSGGVLSHFAAGNYGSPEHAVKAIALATGALVGAQVGARIAVRLPPHALTRLLGAMLFLLAVQALIAAFRG